MKWIPLTSIPFGTAWILDLSFPLEIPLEVTFLRDDPREFSFDNLKSSPLSLPLKSPLVLPYTLSNFFFSSTDPRFDSPVFHSSSPLQ